MLLFFETANFFNLQADFIFYDTTSAPFSIDYEDEDDAEGAFRKFGRAKESGWGPQVVVALAVTREKLPVRSWVFPGNTTDVGTVEKVRSDLRGCGTLTVPSLLPMPGRTLPCMWKIPSCSPYGQSQRDQTECPWQTGSIHGDQGLHAKEVVVGEGGR